MTINYIVVGVILWVLVSLAIVGAKLSYMAEGHKDRDLDLAVIIIATLPIFPLTILYYVIKHINNKKLMKACKQHKMDDSVLNWLDSVAKETKC